jgi:hypothetical protein
MVVDMPERIAPSFSSGRTARRWFLALLPGAFISVALAARAQTPEDTLHVLKGDNIERLRLDFNASRSKVRLLFLLSPT